MKIIQTQSGGAVSVTNASVNTALAANPSASLYALGSETRQPLGMASAAFQGAVKDLSVVTFGDSFVNFPPLNLASSYPLSGGYCRSGDSVAVSGTSSVVTDWSYPGGEQVSLQSGATRRWGVYNVSNADSPFLKASKFRIYYVIGPGTLRLRSATGTSTTFTDITGHTAIDTSVGTAGAIGVRTVTMSGPSAANYYRIDTVSDSGTIRILGVEALEDTTGNRDSMRVANVGLGGSFASSWKNITQANWNTMMSNMAPHLIVFKAWQDHINLSVSDWSDTLDRIRAAAPNAVLLLVGTHPTSSYSDPTVDPTGWDAAMKAYAAANRQSVIFCDIRRYWPSYANMLSSGLIAGDGVHLMPSGCAYQSALLKTFVPMLVSPPDIRADLSKQVLYRLPGARGNIFTRYGDGPRWEVAGDLSNASGDIGFTNVVGTGVVTTPGPSFHAFLTGGSNFRVSAGYALGTTPSNHQFVVTGRNIFRAMFANFGDANFTLTRDASARVEFVPASTDEAAIAVGGIAGQTGDILPISTGVSLSNPGTKVAAFDNVGNLRFDTAGIGLKIKTGANARIGTGAQLAAGTVTVSNTSVTANTQVILTKTAHGGTGGTSYLVTKSAGASFTITAIDASGATVTTDTSTFDWQLIERS